MLICLCRKTIYQSQFCVHLPRTRRQFFYDGDQSKFDLGCIRFQILRTNSLAERFICSICFFPAVSKWSENNLDC